MPRLDRNLRKFYSNVLIFPRDERRQHEKKVDRFINSLRHELRNSVGIGIKKIEISGSFAKQTNLRKTGKDPIDIDLVVIVAKRKKNPSQSKLIEEVNCLLKSHYPNKPKMDFKVRDKAATISFRSTGMDIDVVPALEVEGKPNHADQYISGKQYPIRTCASCQVRFIKKRQGKDQDFRILVQLAKKWRNETKLKPLKSYTIELIMAHLLDKGELIGRLDQKFMKFLHYLAKTKLCEKISFTGNLTNQVKINGPVIIIDPSCNTNNVANNIDEKGRKRIVNAALEAFNKFQQALNNNDTAILKEIFGPEFSEKNVK